jgi:hypothetical protein
VFWSSGILKLKRCRKYSRRGWGVLEFRNIETEGKQKIF